MHIHDVPATGSPALPPKKYRVQGRGSLPARTLKGTPPYHGCAAVHVRLLVNAHLHKASPHHVASPAPVAPLHGTFLSTSTTRSDGSARSSTSALHKPMMPAPRMHTSAVMSWEGAPAAAVAAAADAAVRCRCRAAARQGRRAAAVAERPAAACGRAAPLARRGAAAERVD